MRFGLNHFPFSELSRPLLHAYSVMSNSLWPYGLEPSSIKFLVGSPRQEYWSEIPFPASGDLPDPGINLSFLCLLHWQTDSLLLSHMGSQTFGRWSLLLFSQGYSVSDSDFLCGYNGTLSQREDNEFKFGHFWVWKNVNGIAKWTHYSFNYTEAQLWILR